MSFAREQNKLVAAALALAVHGFFLMLLIIGVSWRIHDPQPVMAELWQALPEPVKPLPQQDPQPPLPEPKPLPKPLPKSELKQELRSIPKAQPESKVPDPDIALEKKQEKKKQEELAKRTLVLEKKKQEEMEKRRREEERLKELEIVQKATRLEIDKLKREQERKLAEEKQREALRREQERKLVEEKQREALKREQEEIERRMIEEALALEASEVKARQAKAAADKRAEEIGKIVDHYKAKISDKVRGNTRLPENLSSNLEVVFVVNVLPTGEITQIKLVKSSGNTAYDQAVKKAIAKSSPLPLPPDREAASYFRELELRHKP